MVGPTHHHRGGGGPRDAARGRAEGDHVLDKTRLCVFFAKGQCMRGKACSFAHGEEELVPQPNLYRTGLCFDFLKRGVCRVGVKCKFAHTQEELRPSAALPDTSAAFAAAAVAAAEAAAAAAKVGTPIDPRSVQRQIKAVQRQATKLQMQLQALQQLAATSGPTKRGAPRQGGEHEAGGAAFARFQARVAESSSSTCTGSDGPDDYANMSSTVDDDGPWTHSAGRATESGDDGGHISSPDPEAVPPKPGFSDDTRATHADVSHADVSLFIKNTFIEVEPAANGPLRARSAPPRHGAVGRHGH